MLTWPISVRAAEIVGIAESLPMLMQKIRDNAAWVVLIAVVCFVALIFVDWGMSPGNSMTQKTVVGKVDGEAIRFEELDRFVQQQATQATKQGRELSAEDYAHLRRQVFDELVNQQIMGKIFAKYELQGTPEEVLDYLRRNPPPGAEKAPIFMGPDSQFSRERYEKWLADPRIYADPYMRMMEAEVTSSSLPQEQLQQLFKASSFPSSLELAFRARREMTHGWGTLLVTNDDSFRVSSVSEAEMRKYFEANKDSFYFAKEAALIPYISLQRTASHDDSIRVREDVDTLLAHIHAGESFDTLAKDYSEDPGSAAQYGSLGGFQKRDSWVPAFANVVATLQPGQISAPVQTSFGWHLIRLNATKVEGADTLYDASHILMRVTASPEAIEALKDSLGKIAEKVKAGTAFHAAAKAAGFRVDTVRVVRGELASTNMGDVTGISAWAFRGQKEEKVSEVLDNENGLFLAGPGKVNPPGPDYEAAKGRIEHELLSRLRRKQANDWLTSKLPAIAACKSDSLCLSAIGKVDVSVLADRPAESYYPGFRFGAPSFYRAWGEASSKLKSWSKPQITVFGMGMLWLDSVAAPSEADLQAAAKSPEQRMRAMSAAQQSALPSWIASRRKEAKIVDNLDRFYRD